VTDDPIHTLERELLAAARRANQDLARHPATVDRVDRGNLPLRRALVFASVLVPVLVVLAVALVVRSASGGSHATGSSSASGPAPSTVLGVLRRPGVAPRGQALTTVERVARTVRDPTVTLQRASLRQIAVSVAPGATVPLDLTVVRAADGGRLIGLTVPAHSNSGQGTSQMMYVYADQADQAYSTVAQLRAGGIGAWLGQDRDGTEDYAVLVPDGVARVQLDVPGNPIARVHDNVAGFRLSNISASSLAKQLGMTWLDAAGRVVHRVDGVRLPGPAQLHAQVNASIRTLRAHLAVLRRRPTAADRAQWAALRDAAPPGATLITASARVARTTRTSGPIVVALVRETADGTAGVLIQTAHGGGCCTAPSQLLSLGDLSSESGPGGTSERLVLVPDEVRSVALHFRGRTVRANVIGNVAVLSGTGQLGVSASMTWYGAGGRLVRRVPAGLTDRPPPSHPAPPISSARVSGGETRRPARLCRARNRDKILAAARTALADPGVMAAGRPLLLAAQRSHEVREDLTLEQVLDMIVAIAAIDGNPEYLEPILQTTLDGLFVPTDAESRRTAAD
jgi:hypothetical protein